MVGRVFISGCSLVAITVGCATPPASDRAAATTAYHVQLAAAQMETGQPAALSIEPHLEGAHDVDYYVLLAMERNPEIIAAQRAVTAQAQTIPQVTALSDPILSDVFQPVGNHSVQTAAGRGPNTLTLSQKLPWLSKLRVRGEVAEQETKMALTRLAQAQLGVIEEVKLSYYELAYIQTAEEIITSDQGVLEQLLQFAEARYRAGTTSQQDVLRAQVALERLEDRLIELERRRKSAQADLSKLLHTSPDSNLRAESDVGIPPIPQQLDALYEAAVRCRPELQERLHAIIRDERKLELARLKYYPDFNVGLGWQAITDDRALSPVSNGNDNISFLVGMSLPVWRDKLNAGVREAENRTVESARRYDSARDDTLRRIRRLIVQAEALEEQVELFQFGVIPKTERALRISAADYRVSKLEFQQILDNWSDLLMFHLQVARLQANLNQTLASLERVIGCQLAALSEVHGDFLPSPAPSQNDDVSEVDTQSAAVEDTQLPDDEATTQQEPSEPPPSDGDQ